MRLFQKIYRLFSVLFCIGLVLVLLTGVSFICRHLVMRKIREQ